MFSLFQPKLDEKTRDLARYIYVLMTESGQTCDRFFLAKIMYLADVASYRYTGKKITNIAWKWFPFGPFNGDVYDCQKDCYELGMLEPRELGERTKHACTAYVHVRNLSDMESALTRKVVEQVHDMNFDQLSELAYATPPMRAINATRNGEATKEVLDFHSISRKELEPAA
jgi:hypothetical protein